MLKKLLTAAALVAALTAVTAGSAPAASTGKCLAKEVKLHGQTAIANCGSATATLRYKGASYRFKNGTCLKTGQTVTLDLGTNMLGSNNFGEPHFSLTMLSLSGAPVIADSGKLLINGTAKLSSRGVSGTFTGTNTVVKGAKISEVPFSGSWHCGAIYPF